MRNLKSKNPKEYWKIINSIDNKKLDSNIELDSLYSFFRDLNAEPGLERHQTIDNMNIDDDEVLNSPITDCEILKCIKSLKNNKACSNDQIINEYIKSTAEIMLPLYNSFFNLFLKLVYCLILGLKELLNPYIRIKVTLSSLRIIGL